MGLRQRCRLGLALTFLVGCGGESIRETRVGSAFELNGQETTLADQYDAQEPKRADLQTRCRYWQGRATDARRPHALGVLVWQADHFTNLQAWTATRVQETCGDARIDRLPPTLTANAHDSVVDVLLAKGERPISNEQVTLTLGPSNPGWGSAGNAPTRLRAGLPTTAPFVAGDDWIGTYYCSQGETALTLHITQGPPQVTALFDFQAGTGAAGTFSVSGVFDPMRRHLRLLAGAWVNRPQGYVPVNLDGSVDPAGQVYSGNILGPGCSGFRVNRRAQAGASIDVQIVQTAPSDGQLALNTDPNGHAVFDLTNVKSTPALAQYPSAVVRHPGARDIAVNLSALPLAARWKSDVIAGQVAQQAQTNKIACSNARQLTDLRNCAALFVKVDTQPDDAKAEILDTATKAYARVFDAAEAGLTQSCKTNTDFCTSAAELLNNQLTQAQQLIVGTLPVLADAPQRIARIQKLAEAAKQAQAAALKQAQSAVQQREAQQQAAQRHAQCVSTCSSACSGDAHCRSECVTEKCSN